MKRSQSIFFFLLLLTAPMAAHAQSCTTVVCNAANTSESAFLAALPSSSNTNATVVVNVPAGTSGWTSNLTYTVPASITSLTIQGATVMNCIGTPGTSSYACTAADNTVIQDSFTSGSNQSTIIFHLGGASTSFRMTGLTIEGGTGNVKNDGILVIYGPSHNLRLDHDHFNTSTYSTTFSTFTGRLYGELEGVLDHDIWDEGGSTSVSNGFGMSNAIGDSLGFGDGTWANPTNFGSGAFIFIEDSILNGGELEDCDTGGKFVARYNTLLNGSVDSAVIHIHGTKSQAGRGRGCRAYEAYHNYIVGPTSNDYAAIGSAGGPSLVWGNILKSGYNQLANVSATRNDGSEAEISTPTGWGYCGTSAINLNTGAANGVGSASDGNSPSTTGYPCLDGLGRGQGQALNGQNFPSALNSVTGTIAYPKEDLEPIYYWGNTIPAGITELTIRDKSSQLNRDVYIDNSSFDGTTGTGNGLLANRPSTCTPGPAGTYGVSPTGSYGVAYFATDANGGQGELYVCTSTNTWTGIYQPYTYPHPLIGGSGTSGTGSTAPNPPTSLTGTAH